MLVRIIITLAFIIIFDIYAFQAVRTITEDYRLPVQKTIRIGFWVLSLILYTLAILAMGGYFVHANRAFLALLTGLFFAMFFSKILMVLPLLLEDIYRILYKIYSFFAPAKTSVDSGEVVDQGFLVSRKRFISQVSAGLGGLTFAGLTYGVVKGAHDYKVHKVNVSLKNLPESFKGLKIGQLSDIHSGSFWDKNAVVKGVQKLMNEKPDVIFFTGDLVNSLAEEMSDDYIQIFSQLKAPMGVFSILGNHDYGDYHQWPDKQQAQSFGLAPSKAHMSPMQLENLEKLKGVHKQMGWDLLLNENRVLQIGEDKIGLIGVENFGAKGRFAKYGVLSKAYQGTEALPVRILLSHDPSHWDYQVVKDYKDIALTLSGHTHGAQFGIEAMGIKWSPIKYMYKQWAGIYKTGEQYLYVNRGFGYLGYPGRLGIRPEVSILTLS
jgi:predicted MPP superfamily phosphohydrolase